jgi:hypothetical protein
MSTAHSYMFLAAATIGHDVVPALARRVDERRWTMGGMLLVGAAAVALALVLRSVVSIWHDIGSVVTSSLLLPLVLTRAPARYRFRPRFALAAMTAATAVSTGWILARSGSGGYILGLEPIFPALLSAVALWVIDHLTRPRR